MQITRKRVAKALAVVFVVNLIVMGAGVIGASHHYWWIGQPDVWLPLGTIFSTLELIPLILILFEAMGQYRALATSDETFPYTLPFMFIIASGFRNFLGAGVLGFFINLPLVNYYEHGTYLTVGHAHAAMFGAFGFLALGMATYMLRISTVPSEWTERRLRWAFRLWNVGLAVMVFVSVLPVGFLQLEVAFTETYGTARNLAFYNREIIQQLFWAQLPGDSLIILGTVVFTYDMVRRRFTLRDVSAPSETDGSGTIPDRVMTEDDDTGQVPLPPVFAVATVFVDDTLSRASDGPLPDGSTTIIPPAVVDDGTYRPKTVILRWPSTTGPVGLCDVGRSDVIAVRLYVVERELQGD